MNVLQALLDELYITKPELLGRHYQVELGNEKKTRKTRKKVTQNASTASLTAMHLI
jgi:hypothetical protein